MTKLTKILIDAWARIGVDITKDEESHDDSKEN